MFSDDEIADFYKEETSLVGVIGLGDKLTDARSDRPPWSYNTKSLIRHVLGDRRSRQVRIAIMYWLMNRTAQEIASEIGITLGAVANVIYRLQKTRVSPTSSGG